MNESLKPIAKACIDIGQGIKAAVDKNVSGVLSETIEAGQAIAEIAKHIKQVPADLVALVKSPEAGQDLLTYCEASLQGSLPAKPLAIVMSLTKAAVIGSQLGYGVVAAFQMPDEPAAPAV